jgi:hypothetical protein
MKSLTSYSNVKASSLAEVLAAIALIGILFALAAPIWVRMSGYTGADGFFRLRVAMRTYLIHPDENLLPTGMHCEKRYARHSGFSGLIEYHILCSDSQGRSLNQKGYERIP